MRYILLFLIVCFTNAEVNLNPPKRVSACIISANENYINACINGVRYALEAQLEDMLYNEYSLTPIFVGEEYSKCSCNVKRTKRTVRQKTKYDYDPLSWKISLRPFEVSKEMRKKLKSQEMSKQKVRTGIICVKC